jgi:hypothetical protein
VSDETDHIETVNPSQCLIESEGTLEEDTLVNDAATTVILVPSPAM